MPVNSSSPIAARAKTECFAVTAGSQSADQTRPISFQDRNLSRFSSLNRSRSRAGLRVLGPKFFALGKSHQAREDGSSSVRAIRASTRSGVHPVHMVFGDLINSKLAQRGENVGSQENAVKLRCGWLPFLVHVLFEPNFREFTDSRKISALARAGQRAIDRF